MTSLYGSLIIMGITLKPIIYYLTMIQKEASASIITGPPGMAAGEIQYAYPQHSVKIKAASSDERALAVHVHQSMLPSGCATLMYSGQDPLHV